MIVEQIESFKTWLTAVLRPICDADPAALAKYVFALLKKDKAPDELRKSMIDQLDVFLGLETTKFVDLVFQTLQSKEYITTPVIPNANPPNPHVTTPKAAVAAKEPAAVVAQPPPPPPADAVPPAGEPLNGVKKAEEARHRVGRRNSETDKDEARNRAAARLRSQHNSRSRSRSWDRTKRSRSRERDQYREKRDRAPRSGWRNKSPPRRYERRRTRSPSPGRGRMSSPRAHRRYRRTSLSRSRSRSPDRRERRDSGKGGEVRSRPTSPSMDGNSAGGSHNDPDAGRGSKRRCRDYDEKGYCMRGEMCPHDHGVDPVVLEGDPALLAYNPNGDGPAGPQVGHGHGPQPEYNPQAPQMWARGGAAYRGAMRFPNPGAFGQRELINVPMMEQRDAIQQVPHFHHFEHPNIHGKHQGFKKRPFDYNRFGPRKPFPPTNCALEVKKIPMGMNTITHLNNHFSKFGKIVNMQLAHEGDPEGALVIFSSHAEAHAAYRSTEAVLNNRFIKVFWHNNNNNNGSDAQRPENASGDSPVQQTRSVKDRLGVIGANNNESPPFELEPKPEDKAMDMDKPDAGRFFPPAVEPVQYKARQQAAIIRQQELLAAREKVRKNQEENKKDIMKIKIDLRKRKQDLLEKQLLQQKKLLDKFTKLPPGEQRDLVKDTIKKSQESIEAIKADLEQTAYMVKPGAAAALATGTMIANKLRSKEDLQKEMLDMELDLIAKQQDRQYSADMQRKYQELKSRNFAPRGGRGRGRARFTPMGRHLMSKNNMLDSKSKSAGSTPPNHSLDRRPTTLLVSGYESEEQPSVLAHFQQYGEIEYYVVDNALPSITMNFKLRKDAEAAMMKGKHFQDRTLSVTWSSSVSPESGNSQRTPAILADGEEDSFMDQSLLEFEDDLTGTETTEINEEALLHDDEEEDDENEDRSWRR